MDENDAYDRVAASYGKPDTRTQLPRAPLTPTTGVQRRSSRVTRCTDSPPPPSTGEGAHPAHDLAAQFARMDCNEDDTREKGALEIRPDSSIDSPASLGASVSSVNSEQEVLAVSDRVTDLLLAIQDISILLFEIQELRHAASMSSIPPGDASVSPPAKEIDQLLSQLEAKLEAVNTQHIAVEAQVTKALETESDDPRGERDVLRQKWADAATDWESVQTDAEQLTAELKEDKWLVVFRTVSQQAEDMQQSLEKALGQCALFVSDTRPQRVGAASSSHLIVADPEAGAASGMSSAKRQHLLATCSSLSRSLEAKVRYYSPACERVLAILGKGIADRSTTNGEVIRRFGEMKARWKAVRQGIDLVAADLAQLEESLTGSLGTPSASTSGLMSPPRQPHTRGPRSPFRRSANSAVGEASPSSPASSPSLRIDDSPTKQRSPKPTPPRPPKSLKRFVSDPYSASASPDTDAYADAPTPLVAITPGPVAHRRSLSALSASAGPSATPASRSTRRQSLRPVSPLPPNPIIPDRPRWNSSVRSSGAADSNGMTTIPTSSRASRSGRSSAIGLTRPSSRMSLGSSMGPSGGRPPSPAFSEAFSATGGRERPGTPSRIPRPSSRRSSVYGSAIDRAVSPTPGTGPRPAASSRYSLSRSVGPGTHSSPSRPTRVLSGGARTPSRPISPAMSNASSTGYRRGGATPEPSLMTQAQRIAGGPRSSAAPASASHPPPVPRVPSSYRRESLTVATPLATPSRRLSARPPSAIGSYGLDRPVTPLPGSVDAAAAATEYVSNAHDPLDVAVGATGNSLPVLLDIRRVDPHLTRAHAAQVELFQAKYSFGHPTRAAVADSRKAAMCKLVDRVGARAQKGEKKVLVRVGGGWQDLEVYLLSLIANNC
ncbi:hypothetical protein JCM8202_005329 [Rhodotorula sphaerocarpa]